jgi:hypothetical protein
MGRSSLLVAALCRGGRASGPVGLAPEALEECLYSFKVFLQCLSSCEVLVSAGIGDVSAGFSGANHTYRHLPAFGAYPGGVAVRRAPEPGPIRGDRDVLSVLFIRPSLSFRGTGGEVCMTPIERVANRGFLIELLSNDSRGPPYLIR